MAVTTHEIQDAVDSLYRLDSRVSRLAEMPGLDEQAMARLGWLPVLFLFKTALDDMLAGKPVHDQPNDPRGFNKQGALFSSRLQSIPHQMGSHNLPFWSMDVISKEAKSLNSELESFRAKFHYLLDKYYVDRASPLVPHEMPAPVRVAVQDDRFVAIAPKQNSGIIADPSIEKLRQGAVPILARAIRSLREAHNADHRLADACQGLMSELDIALPHMSVEAVGLNWTVVSKALSVTRETVPEIIISELETIMTTVRTLLEQYEEWRIFQLAVNGLQVNESDIRRLANETQLLSHDLAKHPDLVDPTIVQRLTRITDLVSIEIAHSNTLSVSLIGSLSNIMASTANVAINFVVSLPDAGVVGAISAMGSAYTIGHYSIHILKTFAPTLSSYAPLNWIIEFWDDVIASKLQK